MKGLCLRCNCPLTESNRVRSNRGFRAFCKKCYVAVQAERRALNPEKYYQKNLVWRADNPDKCLVNHRNAFCRYRAFITQFKTGKPCTDCKNIFPPECMDFDHIRGKKKFSIGSGMRSRALILEEIAKCELVCANCHRIRTKKRRPTGKKSK